MSLIPTFSDTQTPLIPTLNDPMINDGIGTGPMDPTLPPTDAPETTTMAALTTMAPTSTPMTLGTEQRVEMSTIEKMTIAVAIAICMILAGIIAAVSMRR